MDRRGGLTLQEPIITSPPISSLFYPVGYPIAVPTALGAVGFPHPSTHGQGWSRKVDNYYCGDCSSCSTKFTKETEAMIAKATFDQHFEERLEQCWNDALVFINKYM